MTQLGELIPIKDYAGIRFDLEDHAADLIDRVVLECGDSLLETLNEDGNTVIDDMYSLVVKEMVDASFTAMESAQRETLEKYKNELIKAICKARAD